nr:PREDICTED: serglycin [Anolis carolinensis]|eukprot:XP_003223733.1 PREDICTED: serglycin [Anolis carolinensis]
MLAKHNGRIFIALCVILFTGCTVQGSPVQRGRYMRVRCRPNARFANCIEEQGPVFDISDGSANMILPPKADPELMKEFQDHPEAFQLSGDEYGSGNEGDPEFGSGTEYDMDDPSIPKFDVNQPDQKLTLKLTKEGLFLHENRL